MAGANVFALCVNAPNMDQKLMLCGNFDNEFSVIRSKYLS